MILYRIYTELFNNLAEISGRFLSGFTIYNGVGVYQGTGEAAATIEYLGTADDSAIIRTLAETIRVENGQMSVLIAESPVSVIDVQAVGSPKVA